MPPPKVQPIDVLCPQLRTDSHKPLLKSRIRRLFDRPFTGVLWSSATEKQEAKDGAAMEFEPNSVCLDKMVRSFMEETNEKQSAAKCGRNRCNCFNGNNTESSDDEVGVLEGFAESATFGSSSGDAIASIKGLVLCATNAERNLLADAAEIVEKNKHQKRKDDLRMIVVDTLSKLGYDSSICKSKWEKASSFPAGEYEYIDVIVEGERLLIDMDFRSEFEIARSTSSYKKILQSLPYIFVGKSDRLTKIVSIVSEAARQSLKKKGMNIAPWRKPEYMLSKWLSPYTRATPHGVEAESSPEINGSKARESDSGELELIFGEESPISADEPGNSKSSAAANVDLESASVMWQPPALKPKSVYKPTKIVAGLASLLREKP